MVVLLFISTVNFWYTYESYCRYCSCYASVLVVWLLLLVLQSHNAVAVAVTVIISAIAFTRFSLLLVRYYYFIV